MRRCAALHVLLLVTVGLLFNPMPRAFAQRPQPPSQGPKAQPSLPDRLTELETQVKGLQSRLADLTRRVAYNFASLDCNSKRYAEFRFTDSHLVFFASCENIEPYLEGHKLVLTIGNPYSFNFRNVKGRLQYGKTLVEAVNREVDVSTPETLRSGSWQTLTVIVNPSKPEDMRELWLELKAETAGATQ